MLTKKELFIEIFSEELYNALNISHLENYELPFDAELFFEYSKRENEFYFGNGGDEWISFNKKNGKIDYAIYWEHEDLIKSPNLELFKNFCLKNKFRFFKLSFDELIENGLGELRYVKSAFISFSNDI